MVDLKTFQYHFTINNDKVVDEVIFELKIKNNNNNRQYVKTILANCYLFNQTYGQFKMVIGKNNQHLKRNSRYNPLCIMPIGLNKIVVKMEQFGYFNITRGYSYFNNGKRYSQPSVVKIKSSLKPILNQIDQIELAESFEYVHLSNKNIKIEYDVDSEMFADSRTFMIEYNEFIRKNNIDHKTSKLMNIHPRYAYMVYNSLNEKLGGRVYAPWQRLSEEARMGITINGEDTVELDFRSMNVTMAYAMKGVTLDHDPYILECGIQRGFSKQLFITMFYTTSKAKAISSTIDALVEKNQNLLVSYPNIKNDLSEAFDEIIQTNGLISEFMCAGGEQAAHFQYLDSRVCVGVIKKLMSQGILCLSVHDSYIVQRKHSDRLRSTMVEVFGEQFNGIKPVIKG